MADYTVRALDATTWDAYARLIQKHNGIFGGCWCTYFHAEDAPEGSGAAGNRALKERLVCDGTAHAAVVFAGEDAVGWCQFGPPADLTNIFHRKQVETAEGYRPPDWRITCFFVDRDHRRRGVAEAALQGAIGLIRAAGGGRIEASPQDTVAPRKASFLYSGTQGMFERAGFTLVRPIGTKRCLMTRTVRRAPTTSDG